MKATSTCRVNGCLQSIVTDTVALTSFPTPEAARQYAREHGDHRDGTIVAAFPPSMSADEQNQYWAVIVGIVK